MMTIGLIGCGNWGRHILRDLLTTGVRVAVMCRTEASIQRALAQGATSATTRLADLTTADAFVVAVPTTAHAQVLEALVPLGKPIFVEKPMTADVASARRLAAQAGNRLFVMDKWRYHPAVEAMRVAVVSGELGTIQTVRLTRWSWGNPHDDVNAIWILAPHDLSIALHLIGALPPVARANAVFPDRPDLVMTAALAGNGLPTVTLDISIASAEHHRRCLLIGSRMTLEMRGAYHDRIFARDAAPGTLGVREREIPVGDAMPLLLEIQRFVGHVTGGPPPYSPAADGLLIVERIAEIERMLATP